MAYVRSSCYVKISLCPLEEMIHLISSALIRVCKYCKMLNQLSFSFFFDMLSFDRLIDFTAYRIHVLCLVYDAYD